MLRETRGKKYGPVMRYIVEACWYAGVEVLTMEVRYLGSNDGMIRERLQGWLPLITYLANRHITPEQLAAYPKPEILFGEFLTDLYSKGAKDHVKKAATPAAQNLFDVLRRDVKLGTHSFVVSVRRNVNTHVKRLPRYTEIWSLQVFYEYARGVTDPRNLPWKQLCGLSAGVLMTLLPCRMVALTKIERAKSRRSGDGKSVVVLTHEKGDTGQG
jgi:hypothetical protein